MTPVRLPPPAPSAFVNLPQRIDIDLNIAILDEWVDAPTWAHRRLVADSFMRQWADVDRESEDRYRFLVLSGAAILTRLLQQLGETEIRYSSQAALYRISMDDGWREAATQWFAQNDGALEQLLDPVGWPAWGVLAIDFLNVFGPDPWAVVS